MSTRKLFWNITWRLTVGLCLAAWLTQAIFMGVFAALGPAAAALNPPNPDVASNGFWQATLATLFLALVGGVAGGFFSLPTGIFIGISGGLLVSLVTRLFFYPVAHLDRYRQTITLLMAGYTTLSSWVLFMALALLLSRDHRLYSFSLPWIMLAAALIAGLISIPVSHWVARWYLTTLQPVGSVLEEKSDA